VNLRRLLVALLALVLLAPLAAGTALGQNVDVRALERELRCPTCDTPLDTSNAPVARDMKEFIRERAAEGWTADQIKDALVADFGREVLATPPKEGFDLVAWIVPALVVALGLAAIPVLTRSWARRGRRPAPAGADATPEELDRLQRELERLEDPPGGGGAPR